VMDNFIYGEPQPAPAPATAAKTYIAKLDNAPTSARAVLPKSVVLICSPLLLHAECSSAFSQRFSSVLRNLNTVEFDIPPAQEGGQSPFRKRDCPLSVSPFRWSYVTSVAFQRFTAGMPR
jgi:hypothetical protein